MNRQEKYKNLLKFGFSFFIWSIHVGIWAFFWMQDYADAIMRPFGYKGNWLVIAVYAIISLFFTTLYGGYKVGYYRRENVILSGCIAILFTNVLTYLQTCLIAREIVVAMPFLRMTIIDGITFWLWALLSSVIYRKVFHPHEMLMIYGGDQLADNLIAKMTNRAEKFNICERISIEAEEGQIKEKILRYPSVIICDVPAKLRNMLLKFCFDNGVRVYTTPKISDILIRSAENITLFDTPLLLNRNRGLSFEQQIFKRGADIVLAIISIIVTLPFFAIIAAAVKLQDGGPVFYSQERLTQNGKRFYVNKFRSMIFDAEKETGARLSPQGDERITPVGGFIRKTRLDELPQLWNILIGHMSIVGPRPERPEIADEYIKTMPEFNYRLKVRAGLTGYAQVVGKYNTSPYDKLKMDIMYISGYSILLDIKIIFLTLKVLFQRDSTQGV